MKHLFPAVVAALVATIAFSWDGPFWRSSTGQLIIELLFQGFMIGIPLVIFTGAAYALQQSIANAALASKIKKAGNEQEAKLAR